MRRAAAAGAVAAAGGVVGVRETVGRDNFDRSVSFYRVAIPGWAVYKATDLASRSWPKAERDARFTELHRKWAPAALAKIIELRGFYIKVGQMASSNVGNAFPEEWVRTMEVLQDQVPHKVTPCHVVECIVRAYSVRCSDLNPDHISGS
jgi:predicted unusual protein kinase regulating ubiquinone biosynthesis (AarF/ABC1/UbiB family)